MSVLLAFAAVFLAFAALLWAVKRLLDSTDVTISFGRRSSELRVAKEWTVDGPTAEQEPSHSPPISSSTRKREKKASEPLIRLPRRIRDQLPSERS